MRCGWLLCAMIAMTMSAVARGQTKESAVAQRAVSGGTLTLDEVVKAADERHPMIVVALRDVDAAQGDQLAAEGGFDPVWRASGTIAPVGGYRNGRVDTVVEQPTPLWGTSVFAGYRIASGMETFPIYDQKLATNQFGEVRAGVRVPLLRDGPIDRRRATITRTTLGVDIAKLEVTRQRIEIVRLAAHRYWDWVSAGRRLSIAREWLSLASKRDDDIASRARSGDVAEIDRTENQRTMLQRRAAVVSAERALFEAGTELSMFYRDDKGAPVVPDVSRLPSVIPDVSGIDALDPKVAEVQAYARRPELSTIDAQRTQARVELDLARNQRLPAVDVVVAGSKDFGPGDPKWDKPAVEVSLVVDIPLLARPARGRADSAEATRAKLDQRERFMKERIGVDIRNAWMALRTAKDRADLAREELRIAEALEKAEFDKFNAGDSTLLIVNLREQAAAEAAIRLVDGLVDVHKAVATYRAVMGNMK